MRTRFGGVPGPAIQACRSGKWRGAFTGAVLSLVAAVGVLAPDAALSANEDLGAGEARDAGLTHLGLLRVTARTAVDRMLTGLPLPEGSAVTVMPGREHAANWILADLIAARLAERGYEVLLVDTVSAETPDSDGQAAAPDTSGAVPTGRSGNGDGGTSILEQLRNLDGAKAPSPSPTTPEGSPGASPSVVKSRATHSERVLEFRIGQFGVRYVGEGRPWFLGPRRVERAAAVDVSCRLKEGASEAVRWVGSGDAVALDKIARGKLALYESEGFAPAPLPARGGFRYVEPVVVGGIVAGLVYLFYTNQN